MKRITWQEAEKHLGFRVDRRRAFYFDDSAEMMEILHGGPVFEYGEWTTSCSGCCEVGDYGSGSHHYKRDEKHGCLIGAGCSECGYTGKRRDGWHAPVCERETEKQF